MVKFVFSPAGRLRRRDYWLALAGAWLVFAFAFIALAALSTTLTLVLYPPFLWILFALTSRRLHDLNKSAAWMLLLAVPVIGVAWLAIDTLCRRGQALPNRYGDDPRSAGLDYLSVDIHRHHQP